MKGRISNKTMLSINYHHHRHPIAGIEPLSYIKKEILKIFEHQNTDHIVLTSRTLLFTD